MEAPRVTVIGGGLAGSEAAYQLLRAGFAVDLVEARPAVQSPAHASLLCAEMVCTNSLRSDAEDTAPGLLKDEMRRVGSLLLASADATRVPAGTALAVDRWAFAWTVTASLLAHPRLHLRRHAVERLPEGPTVLASGPLTAPALAAHLGEQLGGGLHFYDAIAPIVEADSIDWSRVFRGERRDADSRDYVNCPLDRPAYDRLVAGLRSAERVPPHPFEEERFFEGCLPVEVMAARGDDVLAFGPLRPVGLTDPRTGERPYAVVQLRAEDEAQTCYNLVGFQTRLTHPEQRRVFRQIPGLEQAEFSRLGSIHRNSYLDAPRVLGPRAELTARPLVRAAGQLAGVEGYLESGALGLVVGLLLAADLRGATLAPPPGTTALGALLRHVTRRRGRLERYEPSNVIFGLLPEAESRIRDKRRRRVAIRERALQDLDRWLVELHDALPELGRAESPAHARV
ncbi:MAG: methylenetetrahydrofolate--tRNA-(uracil(54)-C(5))-methyltransferase (FADH(2)-oxidizing) TrmFO [Deltaproteobacteria bacterium]|nr:methylenetetrahydrofolate--tRNA-(uracil(54)-C(5))-methyltransferase (FADH(2)-oxidizing) TrmFO [Deltaproteobacteria bacterium]